MKSNNNIDQFFKDKLENRVFVLEEAFIADLEAKLDQQGKVGFLWWKLLLGFLLVGGLFFAGFYYLNIEQSVSANHKKFENIVITGSLDSKKTVENEKFIPEIENTEHVTLQEEKAVIDKVALNGNTNTNSDKLEEEKVEQQKSKNNFIGSNKLSNKTKKGRKKKPAVTAINEESNALESQSNKIIGQGSLYNAVHKNLAAEKNKKPSVEPGSNTLKTITGSELVIDANNQLKSNNEKIEISENNKETSAAIKTEENEDETIVASEPLIDELVKEDEELNENIKPETVEQVNDSIVSDIKKESVNSKLVINDTDTSQILNNDSVASKIAPTVGGFEKSKDISDNKKWSVSVFAGPSMISKKVSGSESDAYYAKREEGESDISTLNYGLEVSYFFNKSINLSTGINNMTYGEDVSYLIEEQVIKTNTVTSFGFDTISVFSHNDSIVNLDSLGLPIDTIITPVFVNQTVNDTINTTTNDTTNVSKKEENKNRYTYIQIPIMIGYKMQFNRIGVNLRGGIVYSRLVSSNGRYISSDNSILESLGLKKNIFSIALSTELSYKFSRLRVFTDPKYQFNITNVFPNSTTDQKYKAFGVSFGIGMEF